MHDKLLPHEKIRFSRSEIGRLESYPSATSGPPALTGGGRRGLAAIRSWLVFIVVFGLVLTTGLYAITFGGVGSERLRQQAEQAISSLAGRQVQADFGNMGFSLASGSLLALDIQDASISDFADGSLLMEAGNVAFGVRLSSLLAGEVLLGSARLSQARLDLSGAAGESDGVLSGILDERGLIDPDRLGAALFGAVHDAFDALDGGQTDRLDLADVELVLTDGEQPLVLVVKEASLRRGDGGKLALKADMQLDGREMALEWSASRSAPGAPIVGLVASLETVDTGQDALLGQHVGGARIAVAGLENGAGFERLSLHAEIDDLSFGSGGPRQAGFDIRLSAYAEAGSGKLEISHLSAAYGRSQWQFHGAVGLPPASSAEDGNAAYRFELISDGSVVAPVDSREPALSLLALIAGTVDAAGQSVMIDEIALRTAGGEVDGNAAITFETGKTPGVELAISIADIATSNVKQLWPWFAAQGARGWVHRNLFGGRVSEGEFSLSVAPGRLGSEQPFGPGEVGGRFHVEGARFDVAGRIPPVRGGTGTVAFDGPLFDIRLDAGTIYLSSGRTVDASGGSFLIDTAREEGVIGALDIDVAGNAAAIVELAGYEPISLSRFIELGPDDFAGQVHGKIIADIPLQGMVDRGSLDWLVMLDYTDLSLAHPFNGYTVEAAAGSILIEPSRVVIDAEATLDGMRARVNLVEPLGGAEVARQQDVAFLLDDAGRDRLMPGLGSILSGRAFVKMRGDDEAGREIGVDLVNSTVAIPWAGWSKGPGIPAMASFVMENSQGTTRLENFAVSGDTFAVNGTVSLVGGGLSSARFDNVRLNRSDDFSVDIGRQGQGYTIAIDGESLDARSLVRQLTADSDGAAASVEGLPISVQLRLAQVRGFHDEILYDVSLEYRGTGAKIEKLRFSARTATGHPVQFRHEAQEGRRNITMQSTDAGAVLRFLDLYERMEGGSIELALAGARDAPLVGHVDARDFHIVNEPRLGSIVSTTPQGGERSLNQAVRRPIDISRVKFERGYARIGKGPGYLVTQDGILRGQDIGTTFSGTLYDGAGNMDMTGTFMPAYGVNRLFGQIPILGQILGNGRDGGLIGITFRLSGKAGSPDLEINPLSAIAPGIFRSVFEFR